MTEDTDYSILQPNKLRRTTFSLLTFGFCHQQKICSKHIGGIFFSTKHIFLVSQNFLFQCSLMYFTCSGTVVLRFVLNKYLTSMTSSKKYKYMRAELPLAAAGIKSKCLNSSSFFRSYMLP